MIYTLIGILLIFYCILNKQQEDTVSKYAIIGLFIIGIMFITLDIFFIYQGEQISQFYNEGEGILYKDLRTHENGSTYYVNIQMYDYHDTTVGNYIAWSRSGFEVFKLIGPILQGVGIFMIFYIIYYYLKKFKLIGGI